MMIFSPSLDAVMGNTGLTFTDKIRTAKKLGFNAFEFWSWWDKDLEEIDEVHHEEQIAVGSFCTKFVTLVDPARRNEYIEGLSESIEAAKKLNCRYLISQTGNFLPDVDREKQHESLVDGLRASAPLLEQNGVTLIVEPLNDLVDHRGYYLVQSEEAFQVIDQVGSPNVKLVFDIYHQQITEGNLTPNITQNLDKIPYFHVADHPGRREPGSGEINYHHLFSVLRETGFDGYIGLEYFPKNNGVENLRSFLSVFGEYGA